MKYTKDKRDKKTKTRRRIKKKHVKTKKYKHGGELNQNTKNVIDTALTKRSENLSKMLQVACKDPDNCLALGKYDEIIKTFFDNFQNFNYIESQDKKRIGGISANGFVIEVPFKKDNYTAYTVLKCAENAVSDNLFYEYCVGKLFINNYINKFPCFVETYDLYVFNNVSSYDNIKRAVLSNTLSRYNLNDNISRVKPIQDSNLIELISNSCLKNKTLCLLLQHFDKFISIGDAIGIIPDKIENEFYTLLYQAYFALCSLGDKYTHYDLHEENMFIYKPFEDEKYIIMRYHRGDKIFEFKSEFIVKIIDYGRNYFNNGDISSKTIIDDVCRQTTCQSREKGKLVEDCGSTKGYHWIQGSAKTTTNPSNFDWIDPIKPNMSHDLLIVNNVSGNILKQYKGSPIKQIEYKKDHGTPQNMTGTKENITNIFNLRDALEDIILEERPMETNQRYLQSHWKAAAVMNIYDDGRDYTYEILPEGS